MTDSAGIVNRALEMIAAQTQIVSLTEGTPAANAANVLYTPTVDLCLRQLDPAFARKTGGLQNPSPPGTPPVPWTYQYLYPSDCIRLRQLRPIAGSYNVNDPQPVRGQVAWDFTISKKVIATNIGAGVLAVYTTLQPTEDFWDYGFQEAVARRLANPLAMALAGRPDFAKELLDEAERYSSAAELVDEI